MTLVRRDLSRRMLLAAGACAAVVGAPASLAATRPRQTGGLRIARIALGIPLPEMHASEAWTTGASPGVRASATKVGNLGVELLAPVFEEQADNEAFHAASLAGHIVQLAGCELEMVAARAQALGVRFFRDHTVSGARRIQLDPSIFGVRFEMSGCAEAMDYGGAHTQITGLVTACEEPARAAALAGEIFGARIGKHAAAFGGCRVSFVDHQAFGGDRGLREVHLGASLAGPGADIELAGVTWRRR